MAELLKKFKCKTTTGEVQELSVYTTLTEATNEGEARQVKVEVEPGNFMAGYIGLTKDFDTPKASAINFKNGEEHWKMRKYMGIKNYDYYMKNTYPDTYKTLSELTEDIIPDTSDATTIKYFYNDCLELIEPNELDTRNVTDFSYSFRNTPKAIKYPFINTSKGTNFSGMYTMYNTSNSNDIEFPMIDTSNGIYFNSMYSAQKGNNIFPALNTSRGTNFKEMYSGCNGTINFPLINTENGEDFSGMYSNCQSAISFPDLNTAKGTNFSRMYFGTISCSEFPTIDTSNGTNMEAMYSGYPTRSGEVIFPALNTSKSENFSNMYYANTGTSLFPKLDTRKGTNFTNMYYACRAAIQISDIDLSQAQDSNLAGVILTNMLSGCNSLPSITFNNAPVGVTEEQLRTVTSAPETCQIIISSVRGALPEDYYDSRITRVIQAQNGKLVEWDKNGDMQIVRTGDLPIDDYIVASGDWGTVYSDGSVNVSKLAPNTVNEYNIALAQLEEIQANGVMTLNEEGYKPFDFESQQDHETLINDINNSALKPMSVDEINKLNEVTIPTPLQFGIYVTKDNLMYFGKAYNSTNRDETYQPEVPEGINIPSCKVKLNKSISLENYSYVVKNLSSNSWEHPMLYKDIWTYKQYEYFQTSVHNNTDNIYSKNSSKEFLTEGTSRIIRVYNLGLFSPEWYIGGAVNTGNFTYSRIMLYEGNLTEEELIAEKDKPMLNL